MFQQGEDLIECINKAMAFLVTIHKVQGRQNPSYAGIGNKGIATTLKGDVAAGPSTVVKCYNCQGEGHMNSAFQTDDMDAYDLDCDDLSLAKAFLMANLSSCDPEVFSEVPYSDSYPNDMINQDVQEMQYSEQTHVDDFEDNEIHSGSNIILYSQYLQESQDVVIQDTNPSVPNDLLVLSLVEQMTDHLSHKKKDTVIRKLKDRIKYLSGKDSLENVKKDIDKIETINIELEHSVAKLILKNENLRKEREHLKSIYKDQFDLIRKTRVQSKEHCDSLIAQINAKSVENSDLNVQLQEKTCPNSPKPSEKLVVVTPINKDKRVRFAEPVTSSSNILKQTGSLKTKDSNKPLLTSTGVKPTTSASRSKPSGNTKNNRITRPPNRNQKNKVEDHSRKVKSSLNKTNSISEPVSNTLVKHSVRNAKFESICVICNKCLFDANHDMCIDYVNDVNVRSKSKSKKIN
ncbi:hypothetical protein Tco_1160581 [Tanacetum coccineum]